MITAQIFTYNEEARIGYVLDCLKKFDDIIVIDKSSTDRTREIAKERGARVYQVPYYNNDLPKEEWSRYNQYVLETTKNKWIFALVASDIVHYKLYDEMVQAIKKAGNRYSVIDIPMYRYSMGIEGKHTMFGGVAYEARLYRTSAATAKDTVIHEEHLKDAPKYKLVCSKPQIAVYHLTHPTLEHVMDRHQRYAWQYVQDSREIEGKTREQIMKYAWHEMIRVVGRYCKCGVFRKKEAGLAQCMTLLMYNAMIYLNAFFSKEQEMQIEQEYQRIRAMCRGQKGEAQRKIKKSEGHK